MTSLPTSEPQEDGSWRPGAHCIPGQADWGAGEVWTEVGAITSRAQGSPDVQGCLCGEKVCVTRGWSVGRVGEQGPGPAPAWSRIHTTHPGVMV